MKTLFILFALVACSSTPPKKESATAPRVSNEAFKKIQQLKNSEVSDFYPAGSAGLSPALQDETIDRYSSAELSKMSAQGDPLLEVSLLCSKRQFDEAFRKASEIFSRYQKVASYWNQVANCHLNSGNARKALLFYNKALEVSPNYVPALNNIGVMYSRQGQDQKALVAFERANRSGKFSKTPRYNLARLYLTYGLAEAALPLFESLHQESPQDADLLNAMASCHFLLADYVRALTFFNQVPRSEWRRAEVGLNLALTLEKTGRKDQAQKVFAAVSLPSNGNLKRYYSVVEQQLGDGK